MTLAVIFFVLAGLLFLMSVWTTVVFFADTRDVHPFAPILGYLAALLALAGGLASLQPPDSEPVPPAVEQKTSISLPADSLSSFAGQPT